MNQKDFLKLEKEVTREKREKAKTNYQVYLDELKKEEDVLLSATKLKRRYRFIYCRYHLKRAEVIFKALLCLIFGIGILRELFKMTTDWQIRGIFIGGVILASVLFSIFGEISPTPFVPVNVTNEGIYRRIVEIQPKKKLLENKLKDIESDESRNRNT